jgi:hypothetical protein
MLLVKGLGEKVSEAASSGYKPGIVWNGIHGFSTCMAKVTMPKLGHWLRF